MYRLTRSLSFTQTTLPPSQPPGGGLRKTALQGRRSAARVQTAALPATCPAKRRKQLARTVGGDATHARTSGTAVPRRARRPDEDRRRPPPTRTSDAQQVFASFDDGLVVAAGVEQKQMWRKDVPAQLFERGHLRERGHEPCRRSVVASVVASVDAASELTA